MTAGLPIRGAVPKDVRETFADLIDHSLTSSYRLATAVLGSEAEAQDVVQDAAVVAWQRFGALRDQDRFDAWFQRILLNRCRDRLRHRRRIRFVALEDFREAATRQDSGLGEREALDEALQALSPDHRIVIVLRFYSDLSLEQIADRIGASTGTVKSRLHYALKALRAAYDSVSREGVR